MESTVDSLYYSNLQMEQSIKSRFWPCFLIFLLCFLVQPGIAQEAEYEGGVFFLGGLQGHIPVEGHLSIALPGFRFGGGWEQPLGPGSALFSLESGGLFLSFVENRSSILFPLMLQAAYALPLSPEFSLISGLTAGGFGAVTGGRAFIPAFGPRLYIEMRKNGGALSFFLGGGADFLVNLGGLTPLPVLEAGLRLRLGTIPKPAPTADKASYADTRPGGESQAGSGGPPAGAAAGTQPGQPGSAAGTNTRPGG
ncbi:MAG: hypothetical protein LBK62_08795, partial [Treponema sp.]|nr:hypothetical protein [Treponema sp.]